MSARPVLHYPNEQLRTKALPVKDFSVERLQPLIDEMIVTMRELRGIGLAATQIGVHEQIAVIELKDGPLVVVNPTLHKISRALESDEEGCLSVPGIFGLVPRATRLTLKAYDMHGTPYKTDAQGLFARVIQHEVDHLRGTLFVDRCTEFTTGSEKAQELGIVLKHA